MVQEQQLSANGIVLSVRTWPCDRPAFRPVVLLAGTATTASDWDIIATDLCQDRVVHAINLRGHGASTWPGEYGIGLMAVDVVELLPQLAPQLDVIGHSLGGLVACQAATVDDSPIGRLVLEDVGLLHPRQPAELTRPAGELDFDWGVIEQVRPEIDAPDSSWPDVLRRISCPTLAISGGPASFVPPAHVKELQLLIPYSSCVTIAAGHLIHATQPQTFLHAVRSHIDM